MAKKWPVRDSEMEAIDELESSQMWGRRIAPPVSVTSDGDTVDIHRADGTVQRFSPLERRRYLRRMEWAIRGGIGFLAFVLGAVVAGRARW